MLQGMLFCHIENSMLTIFRLFSVVSQEMRYTFEGNIFIFTSKGNFT